MPLWKARMYGKVGFYVGSPSREQSRRFGYGDGDMAYVFVVEGDSAGLRGVISRTSSSPIVARTWNGCQAENRRSG